MCNLRNWQKTHTTQLGLSSDQIVEQLSSAINLGKELAREEIIAKLTENICDQCTDVEPKDWKISCHQAQALIRLIQDNA